MPRKILVVDDQKITRLILTNMLRREYEILEAENGAQALGIIHAERDALSAILLDIVMPDMDGYEVLSRIRDDVALAQIPVIMVTGSEEEDARIKALSLGANDFISKPYNPEIIRHCVKNNIALRDTAIMLKSLQKDRLTGLYSREAFFEKVAEMVAAREPGYYVMSSFDIDNFKLINDQFGSVEGDRILREIGKTVDEDMETLDGVGARISGDNFAVLMPAAHGDVSITRFLKQNRMAFSNKQAVIISVGRYVVTDLSLSPSAIYDRAYIAKQSVKGRYDEHIAYFDDTMLKRLMNNRQVVADVDAAIQERQFEVWYQPQINHLTGALIGAEALVRWRHPEKGLIPPNDFIPLFEQNGFIYELDKYVWEETCACLRRWIDGGKSPVPASVNISRQDIFRQGFVECLTGLLKKYALPAELLRLEITESTFARSTRHIVEIVKQLIDNGFTVEIDDFGSGYSSLNTLKSVPAQVVKLDMRFLEDENDGERGGNILSSVVRMAKWLGMSVIAEGVEDKAQADYLASIGCSYIQGYYYARPMPEKDYEKFCQTLQSESDLNTISTVENLDNNAFWDPKSIDTLIFSSYVGAACIFEYHRREIELLRVNRKFTAILGDGTMSVEDTLKLDWINCLAPESRETVRGVLRRSLETRDEYTNEYVFLNIPGAPQRTYLRATMRVIAAAGDRMLVYCTCENITAQRVAEDNTRKTTAELAAIMRDMPGGLVRVQVFADGTIKPVYYNEGFMKLTGMNGEELIALYGGDVTRGIHPDDLPMIDGIVSALLKSDKPHASRYRLLTKRGDYIWVSTFERASTDDAGDTFINIYFADATNQVKEEEIEQSLLDNLPGGAGIYEFRDGQMRLVYQNKSYWELVGLSEEAYPDPAAMSAVHPDDLPIIMNELMQAIEQRRNVSCDVRLRHLTLGYIPVRLAGRIVFNESGGFNIYATFTPNGQDALSYQEVLPLLLSAVMESAADLFFAKDQELRYIAASRAFAQMAGREDIREIIGKTDTELFGAELGEQYKADDEGLLRGEAAITDKIEPIPSTDGTPHYARTSKFALRDGAGKLIGIFGVGRDTTEARTTASRLELLANSIPGGIVVYEGEADAPGDIKITYFSDGLSRLLGYTREEYAALTAEDPFALVHPEEAPVIRSAVKTLMRNGAPVDCVYRTRTREGGYQRVCFRAVRGEMNGASRTINAVYFDVTESIEKEAAYRQWKQTLSHKPPESYSMYHCNITKSLVLDATEGLLIPEKQLADTTNFIKRTANYADVCVAKEDRKAFLAFMKRETMLLKYSEGIRHDAIEYRERLPEGKTRWLRLTVDFVDSPYTADIEAYFMFENVDERKRAELDVLARAENDHLTGVLNRPAFVERVEQSIKKRGKNALSALFLIDLDGFKQVNDYFGHAVGDETLIEIGQKLRDTFSDSDLVCRLGGDEFMVFMENIAFAGEIEERAALLCALLHKSFSLEVLLSASIGISVCPENGSDFDTLYRKADAALYYVKENGKDDHALYRESMGERDFTPEETVEPPEPDDDKYIAPKRRMLIVDDNEINREYLAGLFRDDYLIDTAAEGTAALIRLNRYGAGVSIVLLDLMMPGTDGFQVLKRMRECVTMQNVPVIVVSGMDERETSLRAIKAGASDYIVKPVDPDLLRLRVASAISKAENEHLRAQNRYLAMQNEEAKRLADARRHSEELSVALHAAEKADLAKSQFLSSMSHEMRTPLNAVIGYNTIARSEMNEAKSDTDRRQVSMKVLDYLTKSEIASRHLLTIINDVLDMSAIESGKLKVEHAPFDFKGLITSLTVMFFSQARAKGVNFEVRFDKPTEEWLIGDQLRVNQVLTNLLSNAVKFTPEGGSVTLTILENPLDDDTTGFTFLIADTGIGMTQEYLGHIWTPFEQAEASISRRFGGSGLGLSITKNLVDLMGGDISVESKSGVGSTFTVHLNFKRTPSQRQPVRVDFSAVNALVADDDPNTCEYIKLLFDRCGAKCDVFTSGRQAVAAFAAAREACAPYTICLIDWRMPDMDGFATVSEIRRIAAKELPIVVVTAYDFDEISEFAGSLGINSFISKPLFQSSLFDLLANLCGQETRDGKDGEQPRDFGGERVLLVEDNNMNMEVAKYILSEAKLAVDCAWNGQEAYDIFVASKPGAYKAILMDVHMPKVDGYQATRMIRLSGHPDAQTIPIIAMTADAFAEDVAQARDAGMNDHIAKPIDTDALFSLLAEYLRK